MIQREDGGSGLRTLSAPTALTIAPCPRPARLYWIQYIFLRFLNLPAVSPIRGHREGTPSPQTPRDVGKNRVTMLYAFRQIGGCGLPE
jgi:hypothetical protein